MDATSILRARTPKRKGGTRPPVPDADARVSLEVSIGAHGTETEIRER